MRRLTEAIKKRARGLDFDLVGITHSDATVHVPAYTDWLARSYHANMSYLARSDAVAKRKDPRRIMPNLGSIVTVGMRYYLGPFPRIKQFQGRVSRYAWGADYHDLLTRKLDKLAQWIEAQVDGPVAHRTYVDFGPLMERELAQRAGLGWIGKNTNLIHPKMGSFVFLGELLLDLELEPDLPFAADRCGSCTACLDACPTGALVAPYMLDARRCISYLTVEHRDAIPLSLRPMLGDWVLGCDTCQDVCPWNQRFAKPAKGSAFNSLHPTLDLITLLSLNEEAFRTRFRDTPLWRPRRTGLLRNAAVVLGNKGSPAVIPALKRASSDAQPLIAEHIAWALDQIK